MPKKTQTAAATPAPRVRREVADLPLQTRDAPITSVNAEARTAELVWTTGAGVTRYDWGRDRYYVEELSLDAKAVRMQRLESGKAPLLDTHARWDLGSVLGVVQTAALATDEGTATVRFSQREDVQPIFQDVRDGIIANVSVGYTVFRFEMIPPEADGELWRYLATDWEPSELSLVPIGADAGAGVRSSSTPPEKGQRTWPCEFVTRELDSPTPAAAGITREDPQMNEEEKAAAEAKRQAEIKTQVDKAAAEARAAERARCEGIREAVRLGGLDEKFAEALIRDEDHTPESAGLAVLREKAKRDAADPTRAAGDVQLVRDETETRRAAIEDAILLRINPRAKLEGTAVERAREYRHMSLIRMAEESLQKGQGINLRGLSAMEIAGRALHSTSDFPAILANVLNKRLREAYQENVGSYQRWARRAPNAPDFKSINVTQLGAAPDLLAIAASGEFTYGTMSDGKETYAVATYGRIVSINRQTLVNDDLRAFDRLVTAFGNSAMRLENRIVYGILTTNAALGSDNTALFHSTHGNLAGSGAAISGTTLGAGRAAMRRQTGLQGEELNVVPTYLIVPATQEQLAYQYTSTQFVPAKSSDVNEFRQGGRTALEPIVESVLDSNSTTAWYLASDSGAIDTVEYCYLDGSEGVYIENQMGFDVDGMKVKARLDFAAKAIDFRGLYKNPGA